jgi:hypothetical protein
VEEERLVELVEDVDDDVVVGGAVDPGPGELAVDEDHLLGLAQQALGPVRHLPLEEKVRVLGLRQRQQRRQRQHHAGGHAHRRRHRPPDSFVHRQSKINHASISRGRQIRGRTDRARTRSA